MLRILNQSPKNQGHSQRRQVVHPGPHKPKDEQLNSGPSAWLHALALPQSLAYIGGFVAIGNTRL